MFGHPRIPHRFRPNPASARSVPELLWQVLRSHVLTSGVIVIIVWCNDMGADLAYTSLAVGMFLGAALALLAVIEGVHGVLRYGLLRNPTQRSPAHRRSRTAPAPVRTTAGAWTLKEPLLIE